jgi:hypothetical protein
MSSRRHLAAGSLALALAGGASTAVATAAGVSAPPRSSLTGFICQTALDPATRGIEVTAVMRPIPSTVRLQIKPELLRARHAGGPFKMVSVRRGGLGKWASPTQPPNLGQNPSDIWRVRVPVANLPAPAYYRLRVVFRWFGAGNVKLAQTPRVSPVCYEPELRPDLVVRTITIVPLANKPGQDAYDATIANRGATAAGPFDVSLAEAQSVVATISIPELGSHRARGAHLVGPACTTGQVITVTADPARLLNVSDRTNSALSVVCP